MRYNNEQKNNSIDKHCYLKRHFLEFGSVYCSIFNELSDSLNSDYAASKWEMQHGIPIEQVNPPKKHRSLKEWALFCQQV